MINLLAIEQNCFHYPILRRIARSYPARLSVEPLG